MRGRCLRFTAVFAVWASLSVGAQPLQHLTLKEAEDRAVQNHPRIRAGQFAALAGGEVAREVRSAYFPTVFGSITGVEAQSGSAIAAGGLSNSSVLDRVASGVVASQMVTDFGRTSNLSTSASLRVSSLQQDVAASRAEVVLQLDGAYFEALRAQAVLRVAEQTVSVRQTVVDQVAALAAAGIRSALDLSFAKVNLAQAQILRAQATNDVQASYARLSTAMGGSQGVTYELSDEPLPGPPSADDTPLIAQALNERPDVARERFSAQAAARFADAERALWFPSVSLIGAGGFAPYRQTGLTGQYAALGLNVTVPLTNGGLFSARHAEAALEANVQQQRLQDLQNRVARDVRVAWLDAQTAFQRLDLTNQLLAQATDALDLAQQRYGLGLSSIVELTQAQLNQTSAQIEQATTRYEYQERSRALRFQMGALQ